MHNNQKALSSQGQSNESVQPEMATGRSSALLWALCACVLSFFIWAAYFKLDVASSMTGEVIPAGQIKQIQHLEGGIVSQILVREGQEVAAGEAVVELSSARSDADVKELNIRLFSLKLDSARLTALLQGLDSPDFSFAKLDSRSANVEQYRTAQALFVHQKRSLDSRSAEQTQKIEMLEVERAAEEAKLKLLKPRHKMVKEQIAISKGLMKDGLANRFEHLDLLKEANGVQASIAAAESGMASLRVSLKREQTVLRGITNDAREKWSKEQSYSKKQLAELDERMQKYLDSQKRTVITAPVAGTVFKLFVFNEGAVVKPGGTLLTLVPGGESLVVEARMMVGDVGYVQLGDPAKMQLMAATGESYQPVLGGVSYISADAVSEPKQPPYYLVRVEPEQLHFSDGKNSYPLVPGVSVQVSVVTGQRTLLEYLLNPIFNNFSIAFNER